MPPHAMHGGGYHVFTRPVCPAVQTSCTNVAIFVSFLTITERVLMKAAGGNHCHELN